MIHIFFMDVFVNSSEIDWFRDFKVFRKPLECDILFRFLEFLIFLLAVVIHYTCNNLPIGDIFVNGVNPDHCLIEQLGTITINVDILNVLLSFYYFVIIKIKSIEQFLKYIFVLMEQWTNGWLISFFKFQACIWFICNSTSVCKSHFRVL